MVHDPLPAHPCPSRPGQDSASSWKPLSSLTPNQDAPVLLPSPDTPSAVRPTGQDCRASYSPTPHCRFPGFSPVLPNPLTLVSGAPAAHPPVEPRDRGWTRGLSRGKDKVGCTLHPGDRDTDGFQGEGGSLQFSREKTQELHWPPTPKQSISVVLSHTITMPAAPFPLSYFYFSNLDRLKPKVADKARPTRKGPFQSPCGPVSRGLQNVLPSRSLLPGWRGQWPPVQCVFLGATPNPILIGHRSPASWGPWC